MGANRSLRRKQEREQVRKWKEAGHYNQVLSMQRNGITEKDLDKSYKNGYDDGFMSASERFMKLMYAACARELLDAGNPVDDVVSFLHGVDHRFAVMYDADDEIDEVFRLTGIRFVIDKTAINRIEEV